MLLGLFLLDPAPTATPYSYEYGPVVRLAAEVTSASYPEKYDAELRAEGMALSVRQRGRRQVFAVGGRAEVGWAFVERKYAVVGYLAGSYVPLPSKYQRVDTGVESYELRSDPAWWTVSVGFDLQFLRRHLTVATELGYARLDFGGAVAAAGREAGTESKGWEAPFLRLAVGARLFERARVNGGVQLACELAAIDIRPMSASYASRAGLSAYIEFDGGRL